MPRICAFPRSAEELYFLAPKARYPLTPDQLERSIAERLDSTVVLLRGRVCGFANLFTREAGVFSIGNVVVAPDARGSGAGRYLVERMIRTALEVHQARSVRISCFNGNVAGLLLYTKLGFEPFGMEERNDPAGSRVALIHMRLSDDAMRRHRVQPPLR